MWSHLCLFGNFHRRNPVISIGINRVRVKNFPTQKNIPISQQIHIENCLVWKWHLCELCFIHRCNIWQWTMNLFCPENFANVTAPSDRMTVEHQLNNIFWCASGDKSGGWGLSSSPTHGMPRHALPADARLLAEGPKQPAEIWADCQHPGQAHPQPQQSQNHGQHRVQVCHPGGLALDQALDACSDPKLPSAVPLLNVTFRSSSHAP